jgi:hypothetical protein
MTCTGRANDMGLWDDLSNEEKQPSNQLELHEFLHEVLNERYGDMPNDSADMLLAKMNDEEYELLWMEAVRRFRRRKEATPALQELQIYS